MKRFKETGFFLSRGEVNDIVKDNPLFDDQNTVDELFHDEDFLWRVYERALNHGFQPDIDYNLNIYSCQLLVDATKKSVFQQIIECINKELPSDFRYICFPDMKLANMYIQDAMRGDIVSFARLHLIYSYSVIDKLSEDRVMNAIYQAYRRLRIFYSKDFSLIS